MKVAIVHDWLETWGGAEQVLVQLLRLFPNAKLFSLVDFLIEKDRCKLKAATIATTFIQHLPLAKRYFRYYLPLFPYAIEKLDLRSFDLIISSCHAVSKGVRKHAHQLHICLCYTPPRYIWDMREQYLEQSSMLPFALRRFARWQLDRLRRWDLSVSSRVDHFIAISRFVADRIQNHYLRSASIIYPPVDISNLVLAEKKEDYYLTVSRLVPYKRVDLLIQAFNRLPDKQFVIVGSGPEESKLKRLAGPNIRLVGKVAEEDRNTMLRQARAFVFAAEEDFGLAPLEAQACGTPVIAYDRGGAAETIYGLDYPQPTGVFFQAQTIDAVLTALTLFEQQRYRISPAACRVNALRFSIDRFKNELQQYIQNAWQAHCARRSKA